MEWSVGFFLLFLTCCFVGSLLSDSALSELEEPSLLLLLLLLLLVLLLLLFAEAEAVEPELSAELLCVVGFVEVSAGLLVGFLLESASSGLSMPGMPLNAAECSGCTLSRNSISFLSAAENKYSQLNAV